MRRIAAENNFEWGCVVLLSCHFDNSFRKTESGVRKLRANRIISVIDRKWRRIHVEFSLAVRLLRQTVLSGSLLPIWKNERGAIKF